MENKEDIRKGFEVWARDSFYSGLACVSDTWSEKRRLYTDAAHHMALMAWQHQAARIAELEAQVKELQREPLSDEKIAGIVCDNAHHFRDSQMHFGLHFARAIEAAHGITQEKQG